MKTFLSLVILAASMNASAALVSIDCNFADYKGITSAISEVEIFKGAELKAEVESVLMQEMGPTCKRIVETVARPTIPGRRVSQYQLFTGAYVYIIEIGSQVESSPRQWVSLFKTKNGR
jgi:hypothetical protein